MIAGSYPFDGAVVEVVPDEGEPDERRPLLLHEIIVVPATHTIRGIATEVILSADDGMPATCALNFDG